MKKVRLLSNFIQGDFRRQAGEEIEVSEHQISAMESVGVRYVVIDGASRVGDEAQHDARHRSKPPTVEK